MVSQASRLLATASGFGGHTEAVARFQRYAKCLPGQGVLRLAAVGVDVHPQKRLAHEFVGDDLASSIESILKFIGKGKVRRLPFSSFGVNTTTDRLIFSNETWQAPRSFRTHPDVN